MIAHHTHEIWLLTTHANHSLAAHHLAAQDGANTLGGDADQHGEVGMELPLSEPAEGITTPLQSTDEESKSWFGGKNKKQSTPPRLLPAVRDVLRRRTA